MTNQLHIPAPAKINLGLRVVARRQDGFHEIETLFATLMLGDQLILEPRPSGIALHLDGAYVVPGGEDNLAVRAARTYLDHARQTAGVAIQLHKVLPIAAGLGGGSSDAAAVLRGLSELYPSGLDLYALGKTLGADVPFLLHQGAAIARGIGEQLEPQTLPPLRVVLVNPGVQSMTALAYHKVTPGPPLDWGKILKALHESEDPPYRNDLEPGVFARLPEVAQAKQALIKVGLWGVLMSGSGSTVFGLSSNEDHAEEACLQLKRNHPHWWIHHTKIVPH